MYEKAIQFDSAYAQAHAGIAYSHYRDVFLGFAADPPDSLEKCLNAARRAVALDRSDYLGYLVLSLAYGQSGQFDLSHVAAEKAIEANPVNAACHIMMGGSLNWMGKSAEAIPYLEKGLELNPKDPRAFLFCMYVADAHLCHRQLELAIDWAQRAISQRADFVQSHLILACCLGHLERIDEAKGVFDEYRRRDPAVGDEWKRWWYYRDPEDVEFIAQGLRKAGWEG